LPSTICGNGNGEINFPLNPFARSFGTISSAICQDSKSKLSGKGYSKAFLSCTARATNEYSNRYNLAYCINVFQNPIINKFFALKDIKIDEDIIYNKFEYLSNKPSDINEHLPILKKYASQCSHITEMGVRTGVSTWSFLASNPKKMISYDITDQFFMEKNLTQLSILKRQKLVTTIL
jgi:hypothetical protein